MLHSFFKCYALIILILLFSISYIGILLFGMPAQDLYNGSQEGQPIEVFSALLLVMASLTALFMGWKYKSSGWYIYALVMAIAAMREHGMHAAYTTMSMLKSRFYFSPDVPMFEKILGGVIILALVYAAIKSLRYLWPGIKHALNGSKHAQAIFISIGFMLLAKMMDSSGRLFPWLSPTIAPFDIQMQFTEETLEMIMAFLFLSAPVLYYAKRRS